MKIVMNGNYSCGLRFSISAEDSIETDADQLCYPMSVDEAEMVLNELSRIIEKYKELY